MATKIRLQRHGKKGYPFYHIVVADSRAPRDGRFIERLGIYNPNTNPATIELDIDKASAWMRTGAQPTDTTRAILSYKGVLYRNHLLVGVDKGKLTMEQADAKFQQWMDEKASKVNKKKESLETTKAKAKASRLTEEAKIASSRAEAIQKKAAEAIPSASASTEASADEAPST